MSFPTGTFCCLHLSRSPRDFKSGFVSQGVTTAVEVHTLLLGLFCLMGHHRSWFLSELNFTSDLVFEIDRIKCILIF